MDTSFDRDTAVSRIEDGVASPREALFAATISPDWRAGRGPHGGYLAAMVLRAMTLAVDDPGRTPRSLTIHYAAAPEPGPVQLRVATERQGRSLSTLSLRLEQGGSTMALALAAFSVPWRAPEANELPMPQLGGPDAERRSTPKLFDGAPRFTRNLVMQPRVGAVPFAGSGGVGGVPMQIGGWIGLPEPRPVDPIALALFSDAWFPPSFIALDEPAVSPTIDLTIHFRQSISECDCDPTDLCLSVFRTRLLHDGLFEEDGVIWAADGSVLAQSRQLGIVMPTDKPVLQPHTTTGAATNE